MPVLAAAMNLTAGPVLELGAGFGSTLMLHGMCGSQRRALTTLESDPAWLMMFKNYGRTWHRFRLVESFLDVPEYAQPWGFAFVDHGISEQRGASVRALRNVPVIVAHDTCFAHLYDYEPTLSEFRYRWNYKVAGPMTSVVSNQIDVGRVFAEWCL